MENSAVVDVPAVPGSDCVLVVGPELVRVPAESRLLRAASKPFHAIFGSELREGHQMSNQIDPIEIMLPEDDATALKIICSVIHHQNDEIPEELPARVILAVAIAANKYGCIRALHFASKSWLRPDQVPIEDSVLLAAAAYRLGNATAFRNITKGMILNHAGPFTAVVGADALDETDWRILGECQSSHFVERSNTCH